MPRYRSKEETLDWANLDFWTEQLSLDIPALKRQVQHLIAIHPNVIEFLDRVKAVGKGIYLVTNAHGKTLVRARMLLARCYLKNPNWVKRAEEQLNLVVAENARHVELTACPRHMMRSL